MKTRLWLCCAFAIAALAFVAKPAWAAQLDYTTSPGHVFGQLTTFSLGGQSLTADESSAVPKGISGAATSVVGDLTSFRWGGSIGDPVELQFSASRGNVQKVDVLGHTAAGTLSVSEHVTIYQYDAVAKAWFTAFDCAFSGTVTKEDLASRVQVNLSADTVALSVNASPNTNCPVKTSADVTVIKQLGVPMALPTKKP